MAIQMASDFLMSKIKRLFFRGRLFKCDGDQRLDSRNIERAVNGVLRAIRGSAAFLRTTLYDGDSVSVREALQLGVPVIATDNGLRPAGVTLIPIGDRDALLAAVLRIAGNERLAPASPVATDDNLKAVLDLYRELVR